VAYYRGVDAAPAVIVDLEALHRRIIELDASLQAARAQLDRDEGDPLDEYVANLSRRVEAALADLNAVIAVLRRMRGS
jgi:alkylation response protein AidB-like acyl-CoA dehydrogenase